MVDDYGDIIHRMMRNLEEYDATPNAAPRCAAMAAMAAGSAWSLHPFSAAGGTVDWKCCTIAGLPYAGHD
jgi:hypothetical protein